MGIWDAVTSKVDGLKGQLPDPAPLKRACSSAYGLPSFVLETARSTTPYLSSVAGTSRRSYDSCLDVAGWAYRAIRVEAPRLISETLSDRESQERICSSAWSLVDLALDHGTKPYTGGYPVYRILKEGLFSSNHREAASAVGVPTTLKEMSEMKSRLKKLETLMAKGGDWASPTGMERFGVLMAKPFTHSAQEDAGDVISLFMRTGVKGSDFIHEQVVPVMDVRGPDEE
ncbi:hypothetical protein HPP92_018696 [Vanilla planifolia]|uniref:Uncharacterized protein n=1 Tax=Vanilla planifolia TaxID=51239 RepID=A0A835Q8K7_VANPL|nr:hypothetical protein HPP92_019284 [Vanilla planifolia]KAG0469368.1 hypothetical protein HPP92_018696 [Vanilla planifolia]